MTHWHPASPGHKRKEFIACYPGGVEHIGRDSTWQGTYDDEFTYDQLIEMLKLSLKELVQLYPPQHKYITEKYWYELTDEVPNIALTKQESDLKVMSQDEANRILQNKPSIMAFNYIWPEYGFEFLEQSILSIIDRVDKYVLYVNEFSYIGNRANTDDLQYIFAIAHKFKDKVEIFYNRSNEQPDEVKVDNIGYHFKLAGQKAFEERYSHILLIQSDEVYDEVNLDKLFSFNNIFKWNGAVVFQPLCYIDSPHWVVTPPEEWHRPSLIEVETLRNVGYDYKKLKYTQSDIQFHHFSYVLRRFELLTKLNNWGHRDNITKSSKSQYYSMLDEHKTNKTMKNLHPIQPDLYKEVKFNNSQFNKNMFLYWVKDIITRKDLYSENEELFKDTKCEFLENPENIFTLNVIERKLLAGIASEMIPSDGRIVEYGSLNGFTSLLLKRAAPNATQYSMDNYGKPDLLFGQYEDQMQRIYSLACKKIFKYDLQKIQLFNGNTKLLCLFNNDSIDMAFLAPGVNAETTKNAIIEMWPKMKNGSIICGSYSRNSKMKEMLEEIIYPKSIIDAPWGKQPVDFYEVYYDVIKDVYDLTSEQVPFNLGFWFARIKK